MERMISICIAGLILMVISYFIGYKGKVELLHSYHYKKTSPDNVKIFTRKIGLGLFVIGLGMLVTSIIGLLGYERLGVGIGISSAVVGVVFLIYVTIKYNGSLY